MALEAAVYQQEGGLLLAHSNGSTKHTELCSSLLDNWTSWGFNNMSREQQQQHDLDPDPDPGHGATATSSHYYPYFLDNLQPDHVQTSSLHGTNNSIDIDSDNHHPSSSDWDLYHPLNLTVPYFDQNEWISTPPISTSANNIYVSEVGWLPPWEPALLQDYAPSTTPPVATDSLTRPKRRKARSKKNKQEIENQRMTHIAVERNRRKQMNDYLAMIKSLMPDSYVQRGDQSSIVGGAINFVKELEQNLHSLSAQRKKPSTTTSNNDDHTNQSDNSLPFGEFFSFPQYTTTPTTIRGSADDNLIVRADEMKGIEGEYVGQITRLGDIEVTMVENHANLKIRSRQRPKQLVKVVSGLQCFRLTILHLNVSTVDQIAFYSQVAATGRERESD